eukprot:TRINITY_DN2568_c0_g1_i2.p1 TRINITY_DN2568_c0_g1~~TRINITY_DN2568_c0_g1_i2.p1  ORF type:complete len:508 (+),score=97.96 TRINITY_DN2568_c0_g1_i2:194-1717(+)
MMTWAPRSLLLLVHILLSVGVQVGDATAKCYDVVSCPIGKTDVDKLDKDILGTVLLPSSPGFVNATYQYNEAFTGKRVPSVVVIPENVADVQATILFAIARGLRVSIKSGGHSSVGTGMRDGTLGLSMARFKSIQIDKQKGEAWVGPAVTVNELAATLTAAGFMLPLGHCPPVGVGGFTLVGGWGWNTREWGLMASNLIAVELITAKGKFITASKSANADYFWAARGAGPGFFGVVTRFKYKLRPLPTIYATIVIVPLSQALKVFKWFIGVEPTLKTYVDVLFLLTQSGGQPVLLVEVSSYAPSAAEAVASLAPFTSIPVSPIILAIPPYPTTMMDLQNGIPAPLGVKTIEDMFVFPRGWDLGLIKALIKKAENFTSPLSIFVLSNIAPHVPETSPGAVTATGVVLEVLATWDKTSKFADKVHVDWFFKSLDAVHPYLKERPAYWTSSSNYLLGAEHAVEAYTAQSWYKLQKLRRTYDPNNLFVSWPSIDLEATKAAVENSVLGPYI